MYDASLFMFVDAFSVYICNPEDVKILISSDRTSKDEFMQAVEHVYPL
jgi:hypothetical protein